MLEEQHVTFCGVKFSTLWLEYAPVVNLWRIPEQATCQLLPHKYKKHNMCWYWWRSLHNCYLCSEYYSLSLEKLFCKAKRNCYLATKLSHWISHTWRQTCTWVWRNTTYFISMSYAFDLEGLLSQWSRVHFSPVKQIKFTVTKQSEKILNVKCSFQYFYYILWKLNTAKSFRNWQTAAETAHAHNFKQKNLIFHFYNTMGKWSTMDTTIFNKTHIINRNKI